MMNLIDNSRVTNHIPRVANHILYLSEDRKVIKSADLMTTLDRQSAIVRYEKKSDLNNSEFSPQGEFVFDEWCQEISLIEMNFDVEDDAATNGVSFHIDIVNKYKFFKTTILDFFQAIQFYKDHQKEFINASKISAESARRFLLLAPILANHKFKVYIDSSNGCFNADIQTHDNGVLSTQISSNGHIYYSYVAQNEKIYKITGVAKFKHAKDFIKFTKVLKML